MVFKVVQKKTCLIQIAVVAFVSALMVIALRSRFFIEATRNYAGDMSVCRPTADTVEDEDASIRNRSLKTESLIVPLLNTTRIIFNRVPKCGSSSVILVSRKLSKTNEYNFESYHLFTTFNLSEPKLLEKMGEILAYQTPLLYEGHLHYINFTKYEREQPAYINVVRDPFERMVSWYYFIRWEHPRKMDNITRHRTFDECVKMRLEECISVQAYFKIVPFFCGQDAFCREPTERSLHQANAENHFAVVGVTDDLKSFFRVLEYRFPQYFRGAEQTFDKEELTLWKKTKSSHKRPVEFKTRTAMQPLLKHDNDFYFFVKQRFYKQLQHLGSKLHPRENTLL